MKVLVLNPAGPSVIGDLVPGLPVAEDSHGSTVTNIGRERPGPADQRSEPDRDKDIPLQEDDGLHVYGQDHGQRISESSGADGVERVF